MDPSRRTVIRGVVYSAALAVPGWQEIDGRLSRLDTDPHARIGMAEVQAVIAMTECVSTLDDEYGGRMARPMAAVFLVNTIIPHLKARASEPVRNAMLSAAADHLYLTGYMAMDEREDGLAQRYYVKALDLARRAGDHLTYCTTLRGMSVQAVDLGHTRQAVRLSESAASASPRQVRGYWRSWPGSGLTPPRRTATVRPPSPTSGRPRPPWREPSRERKPSGPTTPAP
ncbi:hypothetical protein ACWEHT_21090 [Streptomyces sp. NPDC004646]